MKRVLMSLLLLAVSVAAARAQQQQQLPAAPDGVVVLKQSWAKELIPGWENRGQGPEPFDVMIARLDNERQMQLARNAGRKGEVGRRENRAKVIEKATGVDATKKPGAGERSRFGYRYKVRLKNTGERTIKAVDWDYVFVDPTTAGVVARHQFTSEEKIKPGKEKELSVFTLSPPSRTVSAGALDEKGHSPYSESVVLVRVLYSDGSVWQHP
ncbi:MAG TPA: hypothetical protein VFX96_12075 [Pyrinomonadaceae bacterium]|nr:hypothetical protein [Pyrinomonadaceae bacterium]